jgi:hypothetical protein
MATLAEFIAYTAMCEDVYRRNPLDIPVKLELLGIKRLEIVSDKTDTPDGKDTGFYAEAYEYAGKTVVVFRGTDFNAPNKGDFVDAKRKKGDASLF